MTDHFESKKPHGILVVQTAFIGDLLLSIPFLRTVKSLHPQHALTLVVRQGTGEMIRSLNLANEVFEIKKGDKASYNKIKNHLRAQTFHKIYCPHESMRSSLFIFSLRALEKVTFSGLLNRLLGYTTIARDLRLPDALRQLSLVGPESLTVFEGIALFLKNKSHEFELKKIAQSGQPGWIDELFSMSCREVLAKRSTDRSRLVEREGLAAQLKSKNIALFPGSVWNTKRWNEGSFTALSRSLRHQGYQVFILGSPDEKDLCERVARGGEAVSLAGRLKLHETLILLTLMDMVISNDSGSMHMASVAAVPTVAIFGPTVLNIGYRPWQNRAVVVQDDQVKCRPCGKHGHNKCPRGTHECMSNISVAQVLNSITLLSSSSIL